jgi:hypothetical protein
MLRHKVGRVLTNVAVLSLMFLVGVAVRASMIWSWLG